MTSIDPLILPWSCFSLDATSTPNENGDHACNARSFQIIDNDNNLRITVTENDQTSSKYHNTSSTTTNSRCGIAEGEDDSDFSVTVIYTRGKRYNESNIIRLITKIYKNHSNKMLQK